MKKCPKCGAGGVIPHYFPQGGLISTSSIAKVDNEFVQSSEYDYFYKLTAKIEHMWNRCKCGYSWRECCNDKEEGR